MEGSEPPMKSLLLQNIGDITAEEIVDLFSLTSPSRVIVSASDGENNANIEVPESMITGVIKLSGVSFKGRDLVFVDNTTAEGANGNQMAESTDEVTTTPPTEDGTPEGGTDNASNDPEGEILFMVLDVRNHPDLNFPLVNETEVCDALLQKHPNDPHLAVKAGWGSRLGTFIVESTEMDAYLGTSLEIRGHSIPLKPMRKQQRPQSTGNSVRQRRNDFDPDTLKVRIFDAYEVRYRSIPSEAFDRVFIELGCDVVKPTLPERCRERRELLNTNRYTIVKPFKADGTKIDLGGFVLVEGRRFKISYPGKEHFCTLCQKKHGRECAKRVRFDALRALRKGLTLEKKVYSDSTLRLTNQLALSADVACMSGGGIGQICNLIPLDTNPRRQVIINAGTNEMKTESDKEFVFEIDAAARKLQQLSTSVPVTLVLPPGDNNVPEIAGRSEYMREVFSKVETLSVVHLHDIEHDESCHPTEKGTLAILDQVHDLTTIIMDDCRDDATLPVKYRQVQSVFKSGCRGCDCLDYTPTLCPTCKHNADSADTTILSGMIDRYMSLLYPPMDIDMSSVKDSNKRPADNGDHDPVSKIVKTD